MRARIGYDVARDVHLVYLSAETGDGEVEVTLSESGRLVYGYRLVRGGEQRPALALGSEEYEALRRALIGEAIDSDDALRDTRQVRDRLLTLVERLSE